MHESKRGKSRVRHSNFAATLPSTTVGSGPLLSALNASIPARPLSSLSSSSLERPRGRGGLGLTAPLLVSPSLSHHILADSADLFSWNEAVSRCFLPFIPSCLLAAQERFRDSCGSETYIPAPLLRSSSTHVPFLLTTATIPSHRRQTLRDCTVVLRTPSSCHSFI